MLKLLLSFIFYPYIINILQIKKNSHIVYLVFSG